MKLSIVESIINSGVKGLVSAGFGKGFQSKQITEVLHKATLKGLTVVRCPRISGCYMNSDSNYDKKYGFFNLKWFITTEKQHPTFISTSSYRKKG